MRPLFRSRLAGNQFIIRKHDFFADQFRLIDRFKTLHRLRLTMPCLCSFVRKDE